MFKKIKKALISEFHLITGKRAATEKDWINYFFIGHIPIIIINIIFYYILFFKFKTLNLTENQQLAFIAAYALIMLIYLLFYFIHNPSVKRLMCSNQKKE